MKLNKNGWGIATEIIMIFGFILCLLIAIFYINRMGLLKTPEEGGISGTIISKPSNKNTTYDDIENDMKSAAKAYVNHEYDSLGIDTLIITVTRLVDSNYMDIIEDPDKSNNYCSGYVEVESVNDKVIYSPYLNCSDYTTSGYIKRKDI